MKKTLYWLGILLITLQSCISQVSQIGYVKRFNGAPDWMEIGGKNAFGGAVDGGTMTVNKTSGNGSFASYILHRKGSNNTTLIAFRQDSAANSKSVGIVIKGDSLKFLRRATKGGATVVVARYAAPVGNCWIKISRSNTDFSADYSLSAPNSSVQQYTAIGSIAGAFTGWATSYWKALGVASNTATIASSEFARYAGGSWLGTLDTLKLSNINAGTSSISFTITNCATSSVGYSITAGSAVIMSGTVSVANSSVTIPHSLGVGTYNLVITSTHCSTSSSQSFSIANTAELSWVEYPNGQYIYDVDGSIVAEQLRLSLSGEKKNTLNILAPGYGCPTDRIASYSIDEGFYTTAGNNYGWISGIPSSVTLVADGRVHSLTIACVGNIWGDGADKGITNVVMQYFKVGGSPTSSITPDAGLTYVQYPSTFQPSMSSMLRQTVSQFPDFSLPNKYNATLYGFPKSMSNVDLTKRGWRYWGYNSTITAAKRYWLEPDGWAGGARDDAGIMDDATAVQASSWGEAFANAQGANVRGEMIADGEWRGLHFLNAKGLNNSYYFWKKAREIMGNDAFLGEHQTAPYITPATWSRGELSLADLSIPMSSGVSAATVHNLNSHPQNQYWDDVPTVSDSQIPNIPAGARAGDYMDVVVNGYTSNYNSTNAYSSLWATWVNKKYWGNKKVQIVIEGFNETSVYSDRFGQIIRSWRINATKGAAVFELPPLSASSNENISAIANFLGDGVQDWRSTGNQQETNPEYYHCNNPYRGCTQTATNSPSGETYPTTWNGVQDYITAGMYKMSQIPADIQGEKFYYELSLDNRATWITGIDLNPLNAEKYNRPTAVGMKNSTGSKHAILVVYQRNNPTQQYSFYIRHPDFGEKRVSVNGQFPEVLIFQ